MSMQLRYAGEFVSRAGAVWRVEILEEAAEPFPTVGSLTFEADEALTFEWQRTEKEEPLQGSTATLRIESPGDRTYADLYTIAPGRIRMDAYLGGVLYWSGALDPEFYEEPYERASHYVVTLTFSDFGILSRLKYDGPDGLVTLHDLLAYALARSGIATWSSLDAETYVSTYFEDGTAKATPAALAVRSDNFIDEDGETATLAEATRGVLQPLGLRMVQRAGRIYVYDLNGLASAAPRRPIRWDGDSQTLGVDRVANNVRITFSPYAAAELIDGALTYGAGYTTEVTNLTSTGATYEGSTYYSYYPDYDESVRQNSQWDYRNVHFTLFLASEGTGLAELAPTARYFHIQPMVGGPSEQEGVAWSFRTGGHGALTTGWPQVKLNSDVRAQDRVLMRTHRVLLPKLAAADRGGHYLRLTLEMLLDPRYNPFTEASDSNERKNYDNMKLRTGWAFVPVGLTIYNNVGEAVLHFTNRNRTESASQGNFYWSIQGCSWEEGAATFGDCWLAYYDPQDIKESTGILGWHTNRQNIGRPDTKKHRDEGVAAGCRPSSPDGLLMFESFKAMPDGEFIPYPPDGGWLEVTVYAGVRCFDDSEDSDFDGASDWDKRGYYDLVRWLLYKAPKVEVVRDTLTFDTAEQDDIEYSGYINRDALEEITIDTICGTSARVCPTARGVYHRAADGLQLQRLHRAGVTDHPERLLIGTLCSQYAERHATLAGEARMDTASGLAVYTDASQPEGRIFMMSGEVQDVIMDTSEVQLTELSPDQYEAIEEVK